MFDECTSGVDQRCLAARGRSLKGRARGCSGCRREVRSGAMPSHRDRRGTKPAARPPLRPKGYGETGPSSLSPTPPNECALFRRRLPRIQPRLAVTRPLRLLPRVARRGPSAIRRWSWHPGCVLPGSSGGLYHGGSRQLRSLHHRRELARIKSARWLHRGTSIRC